MQVFFGSATASEGIFGKGGSAGQAKNFSDNIKDMTSGLLTSTQVLERWGSTLAAAGTEKSQEYLAALVGLAKSENTAELGAAKLRKTLEQMQAAGEKGLIPTADSAKKAAKELKDAETAAQKAAKAFQKAEDERGKLANAMQDAALEADLADMLNAQKAADELQLLIDKGAELNDELIDIEANSAALSKEQESLDKTMYDTWLKSLPVMEQVNVQVEEMRNRFALLGMEVDEAFMKDYTKQLTESLTKTDDAMEKLATTMTSQVGRALDDFFVAAIKGKASFSDFAESVLADVARIVTQMLIIEPLIADLKAGFANVMNPDSTGSFWDKMFAPSAKGNVFGFAKGGAFTNMLVNAATPFMFANGGSFNMGVMGEAGPEAVVPLRRTSSGDLGVTASPVTVNINNSSGADVQATSRQGPNGATIIDVEVKRRVKEMFSNGEMDRVMRSNYQISRTGL
jgi:lambda family phage tail tape measure protein